MRNLKKLICLKVTDELKQAYQEIQRNPHLYKNTTFELVEEEDLPFDTITEKLKVPTMKEKGRVRRELRSFFQGLR